MVRLCIFISRWLGFPLSWPAFLCTGPAAQKVGLGIEGRMALWGDRAPQRKLDCHTGTSLAGVKECLREQALFSVLISYSNQEAFHFVFLTVLQGPCHLSWVQNMATAFYPESHVMVVFSTLSYVVLGALSTSGHLCQVLPDLYDLGVDTYMVSLILSHGFSVAGWSLESFFWAASDNTR